MVRSLGVALGFAVLAGCGGRLPPVAEVPAQDMNDWRVPAPEWSALTKELERCRGDIEHLGVRYVAQRESFTAYNTMSALLAVGGASTAISGVLQAAGEDNAAANKAMGIAGAVVGAAGPLIFGILSAQQAPGEIRTNYEKMNAAFQVSLHGRQNVLYCQTLLARTPEAAVVASGTDTAEIIADRARFTDSCSSYYNVAPGGSATPPAQAAQQDQAARQRFARRVIDPEFQLNKLTETLRHDCAENIQQTVSLTSQAPK